jgi:hypothetical protein
MCGKYAFNMGWGCGLSNRTRSIVLKSPSNTQHSPLPTSSDYATRHPSAIKSLHALEKTAPFRIYWVRIYVMINGCNTNEFAIRIYENGACSLQQTRHWQRRQYQSHQLFYPWDSSFLYWNKNFDQDLSIFKMGYGWLFNHTCSSKRFHLLISGDDLSRPPGSHSSTNHHHGSQ